MKYKFFTMVGLIFVSLIILSCNQIGKALQAVDTIAEEELVEEEKWDSIVISYKVNYSKDGKAEPLIMYSDGTAKHGRNHGYWNYGSFYRGESEFGYINITINCYNIFTYRAEDVDYYITQEKDILWDHYRDMVAKDRESGYKITAWDVYYKRVETSQSETRNDTRTDGQNYQQSVDAGDDSFFCQQIDKWNDMYHHRRFENSSNNPYAETVMFYGKRMTGKEVVKMNLDFLRNNPDFRQDCYNIKVIKLSDSRVRCNFDKRVTINGQTKEYPSYLYFTKEFGNNWLIDEESDEITDRNLRK